MSSSKVGQVRVICTACPWSGLRIAATFGESGCPKCRADVKKAPAVRRTVTR